MYKQTLGIVALGLLGTLAFACGSDDDGGGGSKADYAAQCERLCKKDETCQLGFECDMCDAIPDGALNCNFSKVKAKVDECTKGSCEDFADCVNEITDICPQLEDGPSGTGGSSSGSGGSSSGSGGKSGSGGTTTGSGGKAGGTGGTTTGGGCAPCVKAEACCRGVAEYAGEDPADCDGLVDACEGAGDQQELIADQCESILTSAASLPVDECK